MEVIGHRGAQGLAPENSLEAIRKAIKYEVDSVEIDLRMQGNTIVLSHDPIINEQVYCPLSHALKEVSGKVPINLEIKETKVIKHLPKLIDDYDGKLIFSSFKFNILQEIHKKLPDYELAVIEKWSGIRAVTQASLLHSKRIHINHQWLWSGFVKSVKHQGFLLYAYTVNEPERAQELESWGVDGIFTDYPNRFKNHK